MSDFSEIYADQEIRIISKSEELQDSPDVARTVILEIGDKKFGFEFTFGKLIHTWIK